MQIIIPKCRRLLEGNHAESTKEREMVLTAQREEAEVKGYKQCPQCQPQHLSPKINYREPRSPPRTHTSLAIRLCGHV